MISRPPTRNQTKMTTMRNAYEAAVILALGLATAASVLLLHAIGIGGTP